MTAGRLSASRLSARSDGQAARQALVRPSAIVNPAFADQELAAFMACRGTNVTFCCRGPSEALRAFYDGSVLITE
jgi:hypothetical protein